MTNEPHNQATAQPRSGGAHTAVPRGDVDSPTEPGPTRAGLGPGGGGVGPGGAGPGPGGGPARRVRRAGPAERSADLAAEDDGGGAGEGGGVLAGVAVVDDVVDRRPL